MGFKFRKSIKVGPARINLSKSGIGYSIGTKGLRYTKKASGGSRTTASIPGTGISYSKDSPKRKSSAKKYASTKASSSTSRNSAQTSSGSSKGCLSSCLWLAGICTAIGLIRTYWWILLIAALIALAAYIIYRAHKQKTSPSPIIESIAEEKPLPPPSPAAEPLPVSKDNSAEIAFDAAMQSIPKVDITPSDPVQRQLLKEIPAYSFSNITRSTRLDSIFPLVFLDVETTGLRPSSDDIIEVSAIRFEAGMVPVSCFTTLCKPRKPVPAEASAINNISDEMVADSPSFSQVAASLSDFLHGCNIAGYNLDFDLRFIFAGGATLPMEKRFYDVLDLAHLTVPKGYVYDYKLETICNYYRIKNSNAHRSLSDCYATSKVFSRIVFDKTSRQLEADPGDPSERVVE